ncbi:MAG: hypothetical protein HPY79_01805 [Bacteroidales bacterium]|nr:hypothetical protein [Bacteroidales bacterium]
MRSNILLLCFIFILSIIKANDSLKFSLGYGTLYGGGLGIKFEKPIINYRINLHLGISGAFLPLISFESLENKKNLLVLYENIDKRLSFNTEGLKVSKNRLIIPFSVNISYKFYKNLNASTGLGTFARVYYFDNANFLMYHYHCLDIFKLFSLNFSFLYEIKNSFFSITFSRGLFPLSYHEYRDRFSYERKEVVKNSYFISFSTGYYLSFRKK